MTGQELLAGLSFVDERFIQEVETATLRRNISWRKVLPVAACLCILIVGAFSLERMTDKYAETEAAAPAAPAPEAAPEEAAPAEAPAAAPRQESVVADSAQPESAQITEGELHHIASATLMVMEVNEEGIVAIVEEVNADTDLLEAGMQVTVVVDPGKVPGGKGDMDLSNYDLPEGMNQRIAIENGAFDAGLGILYVEGITFP